MVYYWVLVQSLEMLSLRKGEKTGVTPPTKDEGPTATSSVIFICGQGEARKVRSASQNFGQGLALAVTRAGLLRQTQGWVFFRWNKIPNTVFFGFFMYYYILFNAIHTIHDLPSVYLLYFIPSLSGCYRFWATD